jgi:hypothetical protein
MLVRCAVLFGVMLVTLAATAAPAAAHGVGGVRPTNYETRVLSVRPAVAGITVRAADLGDRLEVENRTDHDIVVLGYEDEPYLRVGPDGVSENRRSPSTYVNRTRRGNSPVPDSADSDARPEWRRVSDEPVARWHDHRAHDSCRVADIWMAGAAGNEPSRRWRPASSQTSRSKGNRSQFTGVAEGCSSWQRGSHSSCGLER